LGKIHVDHRVVTVNSDGEIIGDASYDDPPLAREKYELEAARVADGNIVRLQHGARIVRATS
jgi:hypothetical protein